MFLSTDTRESNKIHSCICLYLILILYATQPHKDILTKYISKAVEASQLSSTRACSWSCYSSLMFFSCGRLSVVSGKLQRILFLGKSVQPGKKTKKHDVLLICYSSHLSRHVIDLRTMKEPPTHGPGSNRTGPDWVHPSPLLLQRETLGMGIKQD